MNKMIMAALFVGISGTSLVAASSALNLEALPPDLQAKIKTAQEQAVAAPNPVTQYVNDAKGLVEKYQTEVKNLQQKYPYLAKNPTAQLIVEFMANTYSNISENANALSGAEKQAQTLQSNLKAADTAYNGLIAQTFPDACQTYNAGIVTGGWVKQISGSKNAYALYRDGDTTKPPMAKFLQQPDGTYDVGKIGSSAEFLPSIANNSAVKVQLGDDGKGNKVVVCMDWAKAAPQPLPKSQPTKK